MNINKSNALLIMIASIISLVGGIVMRCTTDPTMLYAHRILKFEYASWGIIIASALLLIISIVLLITSER